MYDHQVATTREIYSDCVALLTETDDSTDYKALAGTAADRLWRAARKGGSPVDRYELRYRHRQYINGSFVHGEWQTSLHDSTSTSTTIGDLDACTSYEVQVRAANAGGPGPWSLRAAGRTSQPISVCGVLDMIFG